MPVLTTDEQRDDLEARRRRKEARELKAAASREAAAVVTSPSRPARGLMGGLIAGRDDAEHAGPDTRAKTTDADPVTEVGPEPDRPAATPVAVESSGAEGIDQLIERVRAGSASAEAIAVSQPRRPSGTADLPAQPRASRRRRRPSVSSAVVAWSAGRVVWAAGVLGLLVIAIVMLVALEGRGGDRAPALARGPLSPSAAGKLAVAGSSDAGLEPRRSGVAIARVPAQTSAHHAAARRSHPRKRHQSVGRGDHRHRVGNERHNTATPSTPDVSSASGVPSTAAQPNEGTGATGPSTVSSGAASTPAPRTTGADLLGGIGACVKGC
ncbi:MAG: hypothetical protein ACRDNS_03290 [Trebonia sp.]